MTEPGRDELEGMLEQMADFDRQEHAVGTMPDSWWAVSNGELDTDEVEASTESAEDRERLTALMSPLPDDRGDAIVQKILQEHRPASPVVPLRPPARRRWGAPAVVAVGLAVAAAVLLWVPRGQAPGSDSGITLVPHRIELGGTAKVLGEDDEAPRAYGPGDDFLLRAQPIEASSAATEARLFAVSEADGRRRFLDVTPTRGQDGAFEFRAPIATVLGPGPWTLRVEIGPPGGCPRTTDDCIEVHARIEIVDR
ncbi:MAG: hypothetical protein AAF799_18330 [Myxococcota bacterium]